MKYICWLNIWKAFSGEQRNARPVYRWPKNKPDARSSWDFGPTVAEPRMSLPADTAYITDITCNYHSPLDWRNLGFWRITFCCCLSQWPRGLRRGSAAACLLISCFRITPGAWMSVCCVLSGRRSLRSADHSSSGFLPTVVRRCVWSGNLVNEKAVALWGAVGPK